MPTRVGRRRKGCRSTWRRWCRTTRREHAGWNLVRESELEGRMRKALMVLCAGMAGLLAATMLVPERSWAVERAEAEETARLLAKLLKAGRLVVEQNQALIDDPH